MPDAAGFSFQDEAVIRPPAYSDDAVALAFSARHDGDLLYVPAWSSWLHWNGCKWREDDTLSVYDKARLICRETAANAQEVEKNGVAIARDLTAARTIAAVEKLARSDRRHARSSDRFDIDPWLLNSPGGVIDLRDGSMRPHRRDDLFTKVTAAAPDGDCPRWFTFLAEITQNNQTLVDYFQRFIGYSLTGIIREHAFAFLHGPGGNGKGVLLTTVAAALGDYAVTASADVFTATRNEQHPTHLAHLRGARMVLVTETEEGRPWAEARIKSLVGGDRVAARVMRGDLFEFDPVCKIWISGNHRPPLRNPDPAMRRRLNLIPLTFVPPVPDKTLLETLRLEIPGILAWAVRGCLAWQREGLDPPACVQDATAEYFSEQDAVARWIEERCAIETQNSMPSRRAYSDWKGWAVAGGEDPGSEKRFSAELERRFARRRTRTGAEFVGVRLLPSETGAW